MIRQDSWLSHSPHLVAILLAFIASPVLFPDRRPRKFISFINLCGFAPLSGSPISPTPYRFTARKIHLVQGFLGLPARTGSGSSASTTIFNHQKILGFSPRRHLDPGRLLNYELISSQKLAVRTLMPDHSSILSTHRARQMPNHPSPQQMRCQDCLSAPYRLPGREFFSNHSPSRNFSLP